MSTFCSLSLALSPDFSRKCEYDKRGPFRLISSYGVFPPEALPQARQKESRIEYCSVTPFEILYATSTGSAIAVPSSRSL